MARSFWLEHGGGVRIRVGTDGILLGRDPRAQVVLPDYEASRAHAWVRVVGGGVQVVALGRHPTRVNGQIVSGPQAMVDGDLLTLPGASLVLRVDGQTETDRLAWVIEVDGDLLLGAERPSLVLGGGARDDVQLRDLPDGAATFRVIEGTLFVTLAMAGTLDGAALVEGTVQELEDGATLQLWSHTIIARTDGPRTTTRRISSSTP